MGFVGRSRELAELERMIGLVRDGARADRGVAVLLRGRRRIGKSRLASEFVQRAEVPSMYLQAARGVPAAQELAEFANAVAGSSLPGASVAHGNRPDTLTAALRLLAAALPLDTPSVVVLDELPWLLEGFPGGAGELQRAWDRDLSAKPVLLLLLGSDMSMMEQLTAADQPFHGRAVEMVLPALSPSDIAQLTGLTPFAAFDAALITGGQPLVAQEWERGMAPRDFLLASYARSTSALVVSGSRVLDAEFPSSTSARAVLTAIGGRGERTFSGMLKSLDGAMAAPTLARSLATLAATAVIAADEPLSTRAAPKDRRWRIADPALQFWLAFVAPALGDIDRGRPDLALARYDTGYASWRGRAIEPVVRHALSRLLPNPRWAAIAEVGAWWPRTNTPEIDLVAADRRPAASIGFVGTIKWRPTGALTEREVSALAADAVHIPGVTAATPLVAVCPAGTHDPRLADAWDAEDLLAAWP